MLPDEKRTCARLFFAFALCCRVQHHKNVPIDAYVWKITVIQEKRRFKRIKKATWLPALLNSSRPTKAQQRLIWPVKPKMGVSPLRMLGATKLQRPIPFGGEEPGRHNLRNQAGRSYGLCGNRYNNLSGQSPNPYFHHQHRRLCIKFSIRIQCCGKRYDPFVNRCCAFGIGLCQKNHNRIESRLDLMIRPRFFLWASSINTGDQPNKEISSNFSDLLKGWIVYGGIHMIIQTYNSDMMFDQTPSDLDTL